MSNPKKILVVDDEHDVRMLFEQRFRKEIRNELIQFAFAYSGEEALNYLNQHEHEAVLILSDINMPGMSGLELLRKIKQDHKQPPPVVMMITAYGDKENYEQCGKPGCRRFFNQTARFYCTKREIKPDKLMPKILVVDDETDLEILIKQKFRKQIREKQYEFVFAINGMDALNKMNRILI